MWVLIGHLKKTRDGGETWVEMEKSYTGIAVGCCTLAIDTSDPQIVYAPGYFYAGTLGHVSVQTTERYLGCKQRFRGAVNDRIGIEPIG
jgi:hypothetical protein